MIKRKIFPELEKELASEKVIVLTGMRRVGKTTLVRQLYEQIRDQRKVFLDLENPLNQTFFEAVDYDLIKDYLRQRAEGRGKQLIIFLDEIQNVRNLPSVVKYLYDHYQIKFILTGSASFYLKNLFSESLAGRKRVFELFPLDFEEFLAFRAPGLQKPKIGDKIGEPTFYLLERYLNEYEKYGGFPSVVLRESHEEKMAELADIFTSYFQKEVQLLSDFRKTDLVRSVILLLAARVGSKIDVSEVASELACSRLTIQEYLDFLEGTYFLKKVRPYSQKIDILLRGQPKPYLGDTGLLSRLTSLSRAQIFENLVFNLLRNQGEVSFYQSKGGAEIDFLLKKEGKLTAFEVKLSARQTDLHYLQRTAQKLGIKKFYLVSAKFSPLKRVLYPFQL